MAEKMWAGKGKKCRSTAEARGEAMEDRDEFLREITLRICSSLVIKESLRSAFDYLRENVPVAC
jgi:hypothetical protein